MLGIETHHRAAMMASAYSSRGVDDPALRPVLAAGESQILISEDRLDQVVRGLAIRKSFLVLAISAVEPEYLNRLGVSSPAGSFRLRFEVVKPTRHRAKRRVDRELRPVD